MPQLGTAQLNDSLFSLELVVEKVYIPHTPCRFPAIAFRLLDYPTIVIKHVENDLGRAIRSKISFDPYYELPDQFIELKDKHGNFMVNKGKSCLFRIPVHILRQHLANTPLYVMIIDLFPEVPKLTGNSSVPLNTLMDSICTDVAKLGPTVPSIHGDKGLFKLYNLMGKEIGYFVLGFRLLCLGPSLIPHLPESVLLHQHSKKREAKENKRVEEIIQNHIGDTEDSDELEIQLKSSACMTDPVKHDVLLQTVEMEDKAIHVAVSGVDSQTDTRDMSKNEYYSISTQTKRRKKFKEAQNVQQKWDELVGCPADDNNDIIINNIICPPPLFYNSNASPNIKINRHNLYKEHEDALIDDLSDINSYDGQGLEKIMLLTEENIKQEFVHSRHAANFQPQSEFISPILPIPQARVGEIVQGLQVAPNSVTVFPLLTALIQELSCIQSPHLLLNVSNRMQTASLKLKRSDQVPENATRNDQIKKSEKISPSAVSAIAATLTKKLENSKENKNVDKTEKPSKLQNSHPQEVQKTNKQRNQLGQKQSSLCPPKKSKLVYGLTNTQRLRLQKTNPQWLKAAEKELTDLKLKKQPSKLQIDLDDINAAMFSDTLTEVRRLAEKELNNTACEDTLQDVTSEADIFQVPTAKEATITISHTKERSTDHAMRKSRQDKTAKRSPCHRSVAKAASPRSRQRHNQTFQQTEKVTDSTESDELLRKRPVPRLRHLRGITSPSDGGQKLHAKNINFQPSPDVDSSSYSVEVSLPPPDLVDSDEDIPLPDDSLIDREESQSINFQKYLSRDISLPESIDGAANASLNASLALDDNSPLESTRHSKDLTSNKNDLKNIQSTEYDSRQFQSTDEPELQDLASEEENRSEGDNSGRRSVASMRASQKFPVINPQQSENSPVPSVRKSTNKLDPTAISYIPSFSHRADPSASSRSITSKSSMSVINDFTVHPYSPKENNSQPLYPKGSDFATSRRNITPRSPTSPRRAGQKPFHVSLHTDSLSSYMPSDPDNVIVSLTSNSGIYSDDFQLPDMGENEETTSSVEERPRFIPSAKLGYTIN